MYDYIQFSFWFKTIFLLITYKCIRIHLYNHTKTNHEREGFFSIEKSLVFWESAIYYLIYTSSSES